MATELDLMRLRLYQVLMNHGTAIGLDRPTVLKACQIAVRINDRQPATWAVMGTRHLVDLGLTFRETTLIKKALYNWLNSRVAVELQADH